MYRGVFALIRLLLLLALIFPPIMASAEVQSTDLKSTILTNGPLNDIIPFLSAQVIEEQQPIEQNYRLALGLFVKRSNLWQPSVSKWLQGLVSRQTHQLIQGFDVEEVFAYYRAQLPKSAEALFECSRRACGESNNWANDHFRIKQLYGLDQYQFYGVYQAGADYLTLYVVRRGNRRVYIQIDQVVLP